MKIFFIKKDKGFTRTLTLQNGKKLVSGFTLIETLVAVSIFSMSILGLLIILSQGIADTNYAKKKIIAAYLTQEGIEYVRNMRDTFMLYDATDSQTGWNSFKAKLLGASCQAGDGCYFNGQNLDYANHSQPMAGITMAACGASCPNILYNDATGEYAYAAGASSGFTRKIQISQISIDEIKVFSTIYWVQGSGNYNMTFSENLFNWIQ